MPARVISAILIASWALGWPSVAEGATWRAPTDGRVTREFSFTRTDAFVPGRHRGADFAAAPGAPVRAPCAGRVVVAGRVGTSGGVVTIACGRYRASLLPLARITTHAGAQVKPGALVGAAGRSPAHDGIHLGVRRAGDQFGYVDPLRLIHAPPHLPPFAPIARPRRTRPPEPAPRRPAPGQLAQRPATPRHAAASGLARRHAAPRPARSSPAPATAPPLAPWPVWAALGALLLAAVGRGVRWRGREVRTRPAADPARSVLAHRLHARDDVPP